jgi:hypothetical protein
MNRKKIIVVVFFISGVCIFLLMVNFLDKLSDNDPCVTDTAMVPTALAHDVLVSTIIFKENAVFPLCSSVLSGGTIIWVNESGKKIQVSSDPHPVHSDNSEISDGKFVLELEPGQSTSVVLTRRGKFGFHDHLNPSLVGKIIVE